MVLPSHVYLGSFYENVVSSLFFHLFLKNQTNNPDTYTVASWNHELDSDFHWQLTIVDNSAFKSYLLLTCGCCSVDRNRKKLSISFSQNKRWVSRDPFLKGPEKFLQPESRSKIWNLMITELFFSAILSINRGSIPYKKFQTCTPLCL